MALFNENEKLNLEISYYILELLDYTPIDFSCEIEYVAKEYLEANLRWFDCISYLDSIGVQVEYEKIKDYEILNLLRSNLFKNNEDIELWHYQTISVDLSSLNLYANKDDSFCLVRLYIAFRTGSALDKKAIENIINRKITSMEMITLRNIFEEKTFSVIKKRKDNSYILIKEEL